MRSTAARTTDSMFKRTLLFLFAVPFALVFFYVAVFFGILWLKPHGFA